MFQDLRVQRENGQGPQAGNNLYNISKEAGPVLRCIVSYKWAYQSANVSSGMACVGFRV